MFASVEDVSRALGMPMTNLWKIPNLSTGMGFLQRIGAIIGPIRNISSAKDILRILPRDGSVLMIAVHVMKNGRVVGGHAIYAFRNIFGKVRFMDRTVSKASPAVYNSISDIVPFYPQATSFVPYQAAVLYNVFAKTIAHDIPRLVIPIQGIVASEDDQ